MKLLARPFLVACFLLGCVIAPSQPNEPKYYLSVFAYDGGSIPKTHTWAAYFKIEGAKTTWHSISWLPRGGEVSPFEVGPERGINKPFDTTIADAAKAGYELRQFGPFEINAELYQLMEKRRSELEQKYWYKVLDTPTRMNKVLDPENHPEPLAVSCMHAVSDAVLSVDPRGWLVTGTGNGIKGTAMVVWHLSDWFARSSDDPHLRTQVPTAVDELISQKLGLAAYPQLKRAELTQQNNHYCRTLEECRGSLGLFGN